MILTVNLNPNMDKTLKVENLQLGEGNQVTPMCSEAAGKGINVALAVKHLGGEPFCIGLNHSINGRLITASLEQAGILYDMVTVPGELRTSLKVVDSSTGVCTVLTEQGGFVPAEAIQDLRFRILRAADRCSIVTLSGSVPKGVPQKIYADIIEDLHRCGARVVLDADGGLLKKGLKAAPWMVKPNLEEMETLFGSVYQKKSQVIEDAKKIISKGITLVCVSMGALGGLLVGEDFTYQSHPAKDLNVKSTQGAGDAMVAGLCLAAEMRKAPQEMLRYGTAAACATITLDRNHMCNRLDFEEMLSEVQVKKL